MNLLLGCPKFSKVKLIYWPLLYPLIQTQITKIGITWASPMMFPLQLSNLKSTRNLLINSKQCNIFLLLLSPYSNLRKEHIWHILCKENNIHKNKKVPCLKLLHPNSTSLYMLFILFTLSYKQVLKKYQLIPFVYIGISIEF